MNRNLLIRYFCRKMYKTIRDPSTQVVSDRKQETQGNILLDDWGPVFVSTPTIEFKSGVTSTVDVY